MLIGSTMIRPVPVIGRLTVLIKCTRLSVFAIPAISRSVLCMWILRFWNRIAILILRKGAIWKPPPKMVHEPVYILDPSLNDIYEKSTQTWIASYHV
jgi:hypothetical protein